MEIKKSAHALRFLAVDAIEKAGSGHPGMVLGMADIAKVLWLKHLNHNPNDPQWLNRDRFILSNGHGSMLLYALLHLTGYDLNIDDIKNFRHAGSKTPGHPELGLTAGVETTTGPLGQGLANAVGMAIGEKMLAAQFNRPNYKIIDHLIYVFVGDGCLMEGLSHEVASLAGTLSLGNLIVLWDDNGISIDGERINWFSENVVQRFKSYNWHVISNIDGHCEEEIDKAIIAARKVTVKPILIGLKTIIGFGSPNKAGTAKVHGAPLGNEEILLMRKNLNWLYPPFEIPKEIYEEWDCRTKGEKSQLRWKNLYKNYKNRYRSLASDLERRLRGELPQNFKNNFNQFFTALSYKKRSCATRSSSQEIIEFLASKLPELLGGSADLTPSNLTNWSKCEVFNRNKRAGNYIHYGVREFGMSAIMNGIAIYGGLIVFGGTFLVFYSYAASAVRMAALMKLRVIFIYSHDSIGVGEDGPTHQPIEQIAALRATPNLYVWRPCDALETAVAWFYAITKKDSPSALLLSRQNLEQQSRDKYQIDNIKLGGYILYEPERKISAIILASGSELELAMQVAKRAALDKIGVRVVSMLCIEMFLQQEQKYQEKILPKEITVRIAIEASNDYIWEKFVGSRGKIININTFGKSEDSATLFKKFGFTLENVVTTLKNLLRV